MPAQTTPKKDASASLERAGGERLTSPPFLGGSAEETEVTDSDSFGDGRFRI
jgi:hypothetical protein